MSDNETVTPNPAHCPTCGGKGKDLADAAKPCGVCGGSGSARDAADNLLERVYEQGAILTNFHMLATKWEEEVASRQRPLTASAEMMKQCAAEIRHTVRGAASDPALRHAWNAVTGTCVNCGGRESIVGSAPCPGRAPAAPPPELQCPPDGCGAYECHENGCKRAGR